MAPEPLHPARPAPLPDPPRRLDELARRVGASPAHPLPPLPVTGVAIRSEDLRPGDLFVGLPGAHHHGAAFAAAARTAGAVAVLTDADGAARAADAGLPVLVIDGPREHLGDIAAWILRTEGAVPLLLGVTGTNGKTTGVTLADHLLRRLGRRTGLSTTAERVIDGDRMPSRLTTPEADELHGLLAAMRDRRVDAAVIEVSAQALVRGRVGGVRFDVAGFTNLTHDHLDDFDDLDAYFAAKARLFEPAVSRRGVVCLDSPFGARLAASAGVPVVTVGQDPRADWRVAITGRSIGRTRFRLIGPDGARLESAVGMIGDHAAADAALATVMVAESGVALGDVAAALGDDGFDVAVPGRLERLDAPGRPSVLLDVAHTPDAFAKSLAAVRHVTRGRIAMVFGADGDRDPSKRAEMGRVAGAGADVVVVSDHHSRFEDPDAIRAALLRGARSAGRAEVLEIPDPTTAIRAAVAMSGPLDAVLWAGTGRTEYRDVLGTRLLYSFRAEALAALEARADR